MKKGQRYFAPRFGHEFEVTRVSREGLWADVIVCTTYHTWRKRQPLIDGEFAFEVKELAT